MLYTLTSGNSPNKSISLCDKVLTNPACLMQYEIASETDILNP